MLLNHKTHAVIGVLADDTDPMVSVMKLEKAPQVRFFHFLINLFFFLLCLMNSHLLTL